MNQKLIVPVAFVVLAVGAAIAIYFMLQADPPGKRTADSNTAKNNTPGDNSQPLSLDDFDVARVKPDPIRTEKPPQPYKAPKQTTRVIVTGRVVDDGGVPVPDARVYFNGTTGLQGMKGVGYTDVQGAYRLLAWAPSLPAVGDWFGKVAAEGIDGRLAVGDATAVPKGDAFEMPDLKFTPVSSLEGQVLALDGAPSPGAEVTLHSAGPVLVASMQGREPSSAHRQFSTTVIADAAGRYKFTNLPGARYRLSAQGGFDGSAGAPPDVDLTTVLYAWQEIKLDQRCQVRGVLEDQGGRPIPGVVVRLVIGTNDAAATVAPVMDLDSTEGPRELRDVTGGFRGDGDSLRRSIGDRRVLTDSAGRFGFANLLDGEYRLEAKLGEAEARVDDVKINQPDYELQLAATTTLALTVRDAETGRAIEFFDARFAAPTGETQATPFDRVSDDSRFEYHPAGGFLFVNPPADAQAVRISAAGYLPAVVAIGTDAGELAVTLEPLCEITIDLTQDGRRLDFEPVALLFDDRLAYDASSDQLGRVRIPRVAPASYRLKATLADGTQLECNVEVPARRQAAIEAKLAPAK